MDSWDPGGNFSSSNNTESGRMDPVHLYMAPSNRMEERVMQSARPFKKIKVGKDGLMMISGDGGGSGSLARGLGQELWKSNLHDFGSASSSNSGSSSSSSSSTDNDDANSSLPGGGSIPASSPTASTARIESNGSHTTSTQDMLQLARAVLLEGSEIQRRSRAVAEGAVAEGAAAAAAAVDTVNKQARDGSQLVMNSPPLSPSISSVLSSSVMVALPLLSRSAESIGKGRLDPSGIALVTKALLKITASDAQEEGREDESSTSSSSSASTASTIGDEVRTQQQYPQIACVTAAGGRRHYDRICPRPSTLVIPSTDACFRPPLTLMSSPLNGKGPPTTTRLASASTNSSQVLAHRQSPWGASVSRNHLPQQKEMDFPSMRSLVSALRYEDPRLPSPRISLLLSAFRACPSLRLTMLKALTQASFERMNEMKEISSELIMKERDLQGLFGRDHGVGLAELLSSIATFMREDMGLNSPDVTDDDGDDLSTDDEGDFDDEEEEEKEEDDFMDEEAEADRKPWMNHQEEIAPGLPPLSASAASSEATRPDGERDLSSITSSSLVFFSSLQSPTGGEGEGHGVHVCERQIQGQSSNATEGGEEENPPPQQQQSSSQKIGSENDRRQDGDGSREGGAVAAIAAASTTASNDRSKEAVSSDGLNVILTEWTANMGLLREALQCLSICLRCYAQKVACPVLDRIESDHLRDCIAELISAYPPSALKVTDILLRCWPHGNSSKEIGFVQLITLVLACAPLLPHIDDKSRAHLRVFRRIVECIKSQHAGVAEEALMTCSNPRLIALYISRGSLGGKEAVYEMVVQALQGNAQNHWHLEVRRESGRVADLLDLAGGSSAGSSTDGNSSDGSGSTTEGPFSSSVSIGGHQVGRERGILREANREEVNI